MHVSDSKTNAVNYQAGRHIGRVLSHGALKRADRRVFLLVLGLGEPEL